MKKIFLQQPTEDPLSDGERTWCEEKISEDDDEYILKPSPLTKKQIEELNEKYGYFEFGDAQGIKTIEFVRAIEKIHGIG